MMMKRKLKKFLTMFLPHGIVVLNNKYAAYKKSYKNRKETEYVFDAIFSVGIACRPAHYLEKYQLRFCANPLDWMMSYSLDTALHLYQSKFNDFFVEVTEHPQEPKWFIDIKNDITSIHYPEIGTDNQAFLSKMRNRFLRVNSKLTKSRKICFLSNRSDDPIAFLNFLKEMGALYPGEITLINIRNNETIDGIDSPVKCNKQQLSKRLVFIEYEFNDVHPNGSDKNGNPDFWLGNVQLWNNVIEKLSLQMNFTSYLLKEK